MIFSSYEFIFAFLPITYIIYFYLNHRRLTEASKGFLVFSSLFFYSYWNIVYLPLILSSMLFNYIIGNILAKQNKDTKKEFSKRSILTFGITLNIILLGYFKYSDFFIENFNFFAGSNFELLNLALPLAISFFTFQQIAYLVDSYKQDTKEYDFLNYAIFVTFFPQLIAGPIVHHKEMLPQFANVRNKVINYKNVVSGIFIFNIGLFKKVVIADNISIWANNGFDNSTILTFFEAWFTSLSYTFQLYFDFSGYADMAIGAALIFNIILPINFNSPYKAKDIQEFWRRWHITLSKFLKDYIYIPLGGNQKGNFRTYNNLIATFILGGIWHGAGWTFIFWGFLHGLALVVNRLWKKLGLRLNYVFAWFITFNFVNIGWVFFRAENFSDAIKVLKGMFLFNGVMLPSFLEDKFAMDTSSLIFFGNLLKNLKGDITTILILMICFVIIFLPNSNYYLQKVKSSVLSLLVVCILLYVSLYHLSSYSEFLYFNF